MDNQRPDQGVSWKFELIESGIQPFLSKGDSTGSLNRVILCQACSPNSRSSFVSLESRGVDTAETHSSLGKTHSEA